MADLDVSVESSEIAVYKFVSIPMKGTKNWAKVLDLVCNLSQNFSNNVSICIRKIERKTNSMKSSRRTAWIWSLLKKSSGTHLVSSSRIRLRSMIKSRKYFTRRIICVWFPIGRSLISLKREKSSLVTSLSALKTSFMKFDAFSSSNYSKLALILNRNIFE